LAAKLDLPPIKASDIPFAKLPAQLVFPAAKLEAKLRLKGEEAHIERLQIGAQSGILEVSGTLKDLSAPRPQADLQLSAKLDLPRLTLADIPFPEFRAKLPPHLVLPAMGIDGKIRIQGDDLSIAHLKLKIKEGNLEASGSIKKISAPKPEAKLALGANLVFPELKASDIPMPELRAKLPMGLILPAAHIDGRVRLQDEELSIESLHLKLKAGTIDTSGSIKKLLSGKPQLDLEAAAKLNLPEIKSSDIPWSKLPAAFVFPAAAVEAKFRLRGEDLVISVLSVEAKAGKVKASGEVKKLTSKAPEPNLDVLAQLTLPALKSADIPFPGIPPDWALPPSQWEISMGASLDETLVKSLRAVVGQNDVEISGKASALRTPLPALDLLVKCRKFVLEELTQMSPMTREMALSGSGYFALGVKGTKEKPIFQGKMQFKDLGATVAGLKLSEFTGTAKFDEKQIDVPNLAGHVAGGVLNMDLTVKDYNKAPGIDLVASLTEMDLERVLAAKASLASARAASPAAKPAEKSPQPRSPLSAKGKISVGRLVHPSAEAREVAVSWELTGLTPEMGRIDGWAKLSATGGKFTNLGNMASQSPIVKVLLFPFMILQKVGSIGGIRLFPDFNNVTFSELVGDYVFKDGTMTLQDNHLYSDVAKVNSTGMIDLPAEKLYLTVSAQVGNLAPLEVDVRGTLSKPETKLKVGKFLADPALKLLEGIFKK
jgi:hypothetical protein